MNVREWFRRIPNLIPGLTTVVVLNFAGGLLMILQAVFLARIVTDVFLNGRTRDDLILPILLLLAIIVLRAIATGASDKASADVSLRIREDLRMRVVRHVFALGPVYLRSERTGELVNSAMNGIEQLDVYVTKYLPQVVHALLIPVAVWCLVVGTDIWSAVILAVTAPLIPVFMILIGKGADVIAKRQWRASSVLGGHFLDVVRGLTTLKIFNRSRAQVEIIERITDAYREATMQSLRVAFLSALVLELLTTLSTAIVAVMLGLRLLNGGIDFHRAFLILLLAPEFYLPIRMIGTQFHASMNGIEAAKRIFEVLDTVPLVEGGKRRVAEVMLLQPGKDDIRNVQNFHDRLSTHEGAIRIEFDDVSFAYPGSESNVLEHVTFQVPAGKTVAIVGASGAGKSSIFDLLLGFASPCEGQIRINGVALSEFQLSDWRSHVSYVSQRPHLFPGTILENIRRARSGASDLEVFEAARLALVDEFINHLPRGYETRLGEDVRLSGGQIQRIAMARAILKHAPVACFDEPTSQLDMMSEEALQQSLEVVLRGRTALIAAHRMQTVMKADEIVVIESGRVVERGTHAQLISASGTYRKLWDAYTEGTASKPAAKLIREGGSL